jgi:hypothetical protein
MLEPYLKILVGFAAAAVVAMLVRVGTLSQPQSRGWAMVKPSAMHWTAVVLSGALTLLFAYVWLFVGSSRPDGAFQLKVLLGLLIAFGAGTIIAGLMFRTIVHRNIRWRGQVITYNGRAGAMSRSFQDIRSAKSTMSGFAIAFADGEILYVDPYAAGALRLMDAVLTFLGLDPIDAPHEDRND